MKTIVVTGGSAAIGLAITERIAREGWQIGFGGGARFGAPRLLPRLQR